MTCGEKIAIMRKQNNLTQEQLAELLNVSRQSVSKWESDTAFPDTVKLIKMSKVFSCSLDYLLKEEIETKSENELVQSDSVQKSYFLGVILTYLSFPPIFGFIVGIFSIVHQKRTQNKTSMIVLSSIGMAVSLLLTITMVVGFVFGL